MGKRPGITTGAFVLSFAVQRELAHQAGIPDQLTWIFPAIVDGAILGATIAVVALSKIGGNAKGKTFFTALAVAVVFISVYGNAYHAYRGAADLDRRIATGLDPGYTPLSPTGAALIAVIPPLLVLAFTHGLGILIKAIGNAYIDYTTLGPAPDATTAHATGDHATTDTVAVAHPAPGRAHTIPSAPGAAPDPSRAHAKEAPEPHPATVSLDHTEVPGAAGIAPRNDVAWAGAPGGATTTAVAGPVATTTGVAAPVAPLAAVAERVAADLAHLDEGTPPSAPRTAPQTIEQLLAFLDGADLDPVVKATAELKIRHPEWTFAVLAEQTGAKAASTALRRYKKAEEAALAAGFSIPPLPDLGETPEGIVDADAILIGARAELAVR